MDGQKNVPMCQVLLFMSAPPHKYDCTAIAGTRHSYMAISTLQGVGLQITLLCGTQNATYHVDIIHCRQYNNGYRKTIITVHSYSYMCSGCVHYHEW